MSEVRTLGSQEAVAAPETIGGKAGGLLRLEEAGAPVPPWYCVPTPFWRGLSPEEAGDLDPERREAILARFDASFPRETLVAVRSSAVGEDSSTNSFAGQLETYLHVAREAVPDRALDCFRSATGERARAYRLARGEATDGVEAAVVVQQMIESRAAGVLFTANPTTGDPAEAVVAAGLGLGEGVVADRVEADTYHVDLATGRVRERQVAAKRGRIVRDLDRGVGTVLSPVSPEEGDRPALSDEEITRLVTMGRDLADRLGAPQDIEWAIDPEGQLFLLQARPITTLAREQIFDNSNIVESYPGLSSPLTFSFARHGYEQTFRQGSRLFGVPESVIQENRHVHANLVALIDGRMYYNILHWYRLFLFVPGFEGVIEAWEKALGLPPRLVVPLGRSSALVRLRVLWRLLRGFWTLPREVERYQSTLAESVADFRSRDLEALDVHDLFELYESLTRRLLRPYAISLINDTFAQQLYEGVRKLLDRWGFLDPDGLRNDLLCGEQGMESVEPVHSMFGLTERIRADARLEALFTSDEEPEEIWRTIHTDPGFSEFRAALALHLERYGDRTLHELKLETPPAEENPAFLVTMFRNYLRGGQNVAGMEARERSIREGAEAVVFRALRPHPIRRRLFDWVLRHCRQTVKNRENLRLARSRAFGMVKRIFAAIGRRMAGSGFLDDPKDVFYLTVEEIGGQLRGLAIDRDLRAVVARRRADYERFAASEPAPRVTTRGFVYAGPFEARSEELTATAASGVLTGSGCSPGRVRGRAKIILSPDQDLAIDGEILIAPMTDPGWVFLMVAAGGLVVEKGSLLSHTAIIGRELGIPTVVGVEGATRHIPDGAEIEIDGRAGTVRLVGP